MVMIMAVGVLAKKVLVTRSVAVAGAGRRLGSALWNRSGHSLGGNGRRTLVSACCGCQRLHTTVQRQQRLQPRWFSTVPNAEQQQQGDGQPLLYADTADALTAVVDLFQGADLIALDTEFASFPAYEPQLQLVQLATEDGRQACIDCLGMPPGPLESALRSILDNTTITLHSCGTDLLLLRRAVQDMGWRPRGFFDTQVAASIVNVGSNIGLGPMLQSLLDVKLDKSQSLTDWRLRPLSANQLEYAMDDVLFLPKATRILQSRLHEMGRTAWMDEDMDVILNSKHESPPLDEVWLSFRRLHHLRNAPRARAILREIAAWRERDAQRRGVSPVTIVSNDTLMSIAKAESARVSDLKSIQGMKWPMLHFAIDDLQAAIRAGLACKHPPDLPRYLTLTKEQEDEMALRVAVANAYLQQRANELDTALAALLPWEDRGMLGPWLMALDDVDVNALALAKGWRYDVCGHVLCAYRRGDLNLSITPVAAATTTITTTATDAQQS